MQSDDVAEEPRERGRPRNDPGVVWIGANLRARRQAHGMSADRLAREVRKIDRQCDYDASIVRRWERAHPRRKGSLFPNERAVVALARVFKCKPDDLSRPPVVR